MKRTINVLKRFVLFFVLIVFMLLCIVNVPWFFVSSKTTTTDYSDWMSENLTNDLHVKDIAMLGAHDAFSSDIDMFSTVDNKSSDGLMQGFVGRLIKGFSIRQSKTQVVGAKELLESGIRYLDMRLSYHPDEEEYYTVHNYFSSPLTEVLEEINTFLEDNPGEFIILDIQHVYGVDYQDLEDFNEIFAYFDDSGVLDFAYPNNSLELKDITYGDVTNNKATSGILIFSKFQTTNISFWDYNSNIRSSWANEDEFPKIVSFLEDESEIIKDNQSYLDGIRIMQAVATMEMSVEGIARSFETWSLLGRAKSFNKYLLEYEDLDLLIESMPILMLDFTSEKSVIDQFMVIIIEHNT